MEYTTLLNFLFAYIVILSQQTLLYTYIKTDIAPHTQRGLWLSDLPVGQDDG